MYLTKPFEPDELLEFVARVMEIAHDRELVGDEDDEDL
jgi:DNA-binding response OmpR family regulator